MINQDVYKFKQKPFTMHVAIKKHRENSKRISNIETLYLVAKTKAKQTNKIGENITTAEPNTFTLTWLKRVPHYSKFWKIKI